MNRRTVNSDPSSPAVPGQVEAVNTSPASRATEQTTVARRSSPYQCPYHAVPLVVRVLVVNNRGPKLIALRGPKSTVRYFGCPVEGCTFTKPDKWAERKRYGG